MWTPAVWRNGKRTIKGSWTYNWHRDVFFIELESKDKATGENRRFEIYDDVPEWGNWKREGADA